MSYRVNWHQALGEAALIFVGVVVALLGQAWWEYRADRDLEHHLLSGIRMDLREDSVDASSTIENAEVRAAAADELLLLARDPDAGVLPTALGRADGQAATKHLGAVRAKYPPGTISPGDAPLLLGAVSVFDHSSATFSEAVASGSLGVVRDQDLRSRTSRYYFLVERFTRVDDRVEQVAQELRSVLAESGLSPHGTSSEDAVSRALRQNTQLVPAVKSVRSFALRQIDRQLILGAERLELAAELDQWLATHDGR